MADQIKDRVYDAYYGKLGQEFMRKTQERLNWVCRNVVGSRILDVGCSQGVVVLLLGREGRSVLGIDVSDSAIQEALRYRDEESGEVQKNIEFVCANFVNHDFDGATYDTVILAEVLEHLLQPELVLEKVFDVLPAEGRCIVTVPFGINDFVDHKKTYYMNSLLELVAPYFEIQKIDVISKWIGVVGQRLDVKKTVGEVRYTKELVKQLEQGFYSIERDLIDNNQTLKVNANNSGLKYREILQQIEALKKSNAESASQIKTLRQQLESSTREGVQLDVCREENAKLIGEQERQMEVIESLRQKLQEAQGEAFLCRKEFDLKAAIEMPVIDKFAEELCTVRTQLADREVAFAESTRAYQARLEELRNEYFQLERSQLSELRDVFKEKSDLEGQLIRATAERDASCELLSQKERTYLAEVASLQMKLEDATNQIGHLRGELAQSETQGAATVHRLEGELQAMGEARANAEARLAGALAQTEDDAKRIERLRGELAQSETQGAATVHRLEGELQAMSEAHANAEARLADALAQTGAWRRQLEDERTSSSDSIAYLKHELEIVRYSYDEQAIELDAALDRHRKELAELRSEQEARVLALQETAAAVERKYLSELEAHMDAAESARQRSEILEAEARRKDQEFFATEAKYLSELAALRDRLKKQMTAVLGPNTTVMKLADHARSR